MGQICLRCAVFWIGSQQNRLGALGLLRTAVDAPTWTGCEQKVYLSSTFEMDHNKRLVLQWRLLLYCWRFVVNALSQRVDGQEVEWYC